MSENVPNKSQPMSQKRRWLVYGANVAISVVMVVVLAGVAVWQAQERRLRKDITATGNFSLKPQTIQLMASLKSKARIVSLYTRSEVQQSAAGAEDPPSTYKEAVEDLLDEYKRLNNIIVEKIDPVSEPIKAEEIRKDIVATYLKDFKKMLAEDYPKVARQAANDLSDEAKYLQDIHGKLDPKNTELRDGVKQLQDSFQSTAQQLLKAADKAAAATSIPLPDYSATAQSARQATDEVGQFLRLIKDSLQSVRHRPGLPTELASYIDASLTRIGSEETFAAPTTSPTTGPATAPTTRPATGMIARMSTLGDDLRKLDITKLTKLSDLKQQNIILVLTDTDWRVLPFEQVWQQTGARLTGAANAKLRFAGEQQINAALTSLSPELAKAAHSVAFLRFGDAPLARPPIALSTGWFTRVFGGGYMEIASRLKGAGFTILDKDYTAALSPKLVEGPNTQRQEPYGIWDLTLHNLPERARASVSSQPEPTFDQIQDAVWLVRLKDWKLPTQDQFLEMALQELPEDLPPEQRQQAFMQARMMAQRRFTIYNDWRNEAYDKLIQHIAKGGSAMILLDEGAFTEAQAPKVSTTRAVVGPTSRPDLKGPEGLLTLLAERGIQLLPGAQIFRDNRDPERRDEFDIDEYGNHDIARPCRSLSGWVRRATPVIAASAPGYAVTPLLPIPKSTGDMPVWAQKMSDSEDEPNIEKKIAVDDSKGGEAGQMYAGAISAAENGGSRLIVLGTAEFVGNRAINQQDVVYSKSRKLAVRYPGNPEFFTNAIYWLAGMDKMIQVNPVALDVPRIADISHGALWALRWCLLVGMSVLVVLAGAAVWWVRRD